MKKLLFITLVLAALLPVELWAQSTTGGDDGSDAVAAPTFRFDGDYLVIETATEDASIFYQMADLPDMSDETIEKVSSSMTVTANIEQSNYYEQPIELKKSVVLKAIAAGATESEVSVLVYDYDSWHKLQEAIEYGEKIQSLAQDNANVDEDLKEQLKWILYESMHFYEERAMMPYQEAQHFTNHIFEICAQIEQQMGGQTTAEPYAVLSENNTVLTFYYDDQKAARDGMDIGPYNGNSPAYMYDRWRGKFEDILTVVFDDSFANYTELTSTSYWFYRCFKLTTIIGIENLKTDNVTDMSYMFRACSALTSIDVSGFNTANVTKMDDMFLDCSNLTSLDLSNFNTANVKNMNAMFSGCTNLTNLNVSSFSTNDVNLGYMFEDCSNLTSLDLSSFNTSNVTKMHKMFSGCSALNTIYVSDGWSTSSVTNSENMFEGCLALVGGAGTTYDANHIDHTYAHIDGGPSNPGYFTYKNAPVIVETEPYAVLGENNTVLTFYYDDQKAARNGMSVGPFDGNPDYQAWYDQRESITSVVFDASFANCTTITSTAYWFYGCEKLTTITGISNLKTGNVTDMGCMFYGCANLASLDVSHFDTSLVEGMYFMFAKCSKLTNLDLSNFNTSNVKKMHYMFWDCSALQSIALSNFNTSNVIWMHLMFDGCSNLTSLDVSNFDTSNVTEIEDMFDGCSNLTSLDVSHFNTSKAKYLSAMFNDCRKLKSIDVSHFDTSNAESMLQMFAGCYSLTSLDVSNFNTAKVTNMKNMFSGCSNLVDINMSNFNTDNVTDMTDIFANCPSLASIQAGSAMIPANEYAKVENPNLLVYVNNEQYAPVNIQNIVIGDFAKNIVLTDVTEGNGNFYCPQEFKAETITYSHEYNQTTEIDVARGWESIALPFAVQTITHETKGLIAPFGNDASNKHFWLRQLAENGLARATEIEPNTAYLISMPNNDAYYADFNLNGLVTFSSVDVWVPKTQIHAVDYHTEKGMVVLLPNFQRRASDYTTYALNVGEQRGDYPEGSVFEREYRDIRPFEAYTIHQGGQNPAPHFISISDLNDGNMTGIYATLNDNEKMINDNVVYDLQGRRVASSIFNVQSSMLKSGVYIRDGKKVVVK